MEFSKLLMERIALEIMIEIVNIRPAKHLNVASQQFFVLSNYKILLTIKTHLKLLIFYF